jgi:UDP-3-O-[3-hydroxymyristoyl] N-acetylglucosamine deacetylase
MDTRGTEPQTTLAGPIVLAGVGLHSGLPARLTIEPAPADHGVVFAVSGERIPALLESVCEGTRCTGLGAASARVDTVEHVLAALAGLRIDNALVTVEGGEAPVLDGSARPLVEAIHAAGTVAIDGARRRVLCLERPVYVELADARGMAIPCDRYRVSVGVRFAPPVGAQAVDFGCVHEDFAERIAPARTPGFASEWEQLKSMGLALGASMDNVLPIIDGQYALPQRVTDEVATHKALDLVGDLALLGAEIRAHVFTARGGHALNHALGAAILAASVYR